MQQRLQLGAQAAAAGGGGGGVRAKGLRRPLRSRRGSSGTPESPTACAAARESGWQGVQRDKHHPAPKGCVGNATYQQQQQVLPGVFWLGGLQVAVGCLAVGVGPPQVWQQVDAVLVCGSVLHPALQQDWAAQQSAAVDRCVSAPLVGVLSRSLGSLQGGGGGDDSEGVNGDIRLSSSLGRGRKEGVGHEMAADAVQSCEPAEELVFCKEEVVEGSEGFACGAGGGHVGRNSSSCSRSRSGSPGRKSGMLSELLKCPAGSVLTGLTGAAAAVGGRSCCDSMCAGYPCHVSCNGIMRGAAQPQQMQRSSSSLDRQSVCSVLSNGGGGGGGRDAVRQQQRLLWLPVQSSKVERGSLKQHLQTALEFLSDHVSLGHRVLITDMDGELGVG